MTTLRGAMLLPMLLAFVLGGDAARAAAKPSPIPGGANQTTGVNGALSQVLFNGTLRLRGMSLKNIGPGDDTSHLTRPGAGERALVFHAIVSNGTHGTTHGYFNATLADSNGITMNGNPLDSGWSLEPGAAARTAYGFTVPSDFVPVRLVLIEAAAPKPRAFRIAIRPSDLPPAPTPVATP